MARIQLLVPDQAEMFAAIRREMLLDSPGSFSGCPVTDTACDAAKVRASLLHGSTEPQYAIRGIVEKGRLIATAGVSRKRGGVQGHLAVLWGVYVTPGERGRGLGREVVSAAIETVRAWRGVIAVNLTVSEASSHARRLYESLGFVAWGAEPDAYVIEGAGLVVTHMKLPL